MQKTLSELPLPGRLTGGMHGTPETVHCSQLTPALSLPSTLHKVLSSSMASCPPAIPNKSRQKPERRPAFSRQSSLTGAGASAELCPALWKAEPPAHLQPAGGRGCRRSRPAAMHCWAGNAPAADALEVGPAGPQLSLAALLWGHTGKEKRTVQMMPQPPSFSQAQDQDVGEEAPQSVLGSGGQHRREQLSTQGWPLLWDSQGSRPGAPGLPPRMGGPQLP